MPISRAGEWPPHHIAPHTMNITENINAAPPRPHPYIDAPGARDYVLALGRIYLEIGLPLPAAFEAALADYQALGVPLLEEARLAA